jgi:radical SAM-linked protein
MAFMRAGIPVFYSEGFNPLPRLEVVAPLSLGIPSEAEIAAVDTGSFIDAAMFVEQMNHCLPQGFTVIRAENYFIPPGQKKHSLSALLWGFAYQDPQAPHASPVIVPREKEKEFRTANSSGTVFGLKRLAVLAQDPKNAAEAAETSHSAGLSYFDVYRRLYQEKR